MRSSLAILFAASISSVFAAVPFYDQSKLQEPVGTSGEGELGVPGDNPLNFCDEKARDEGLLTIEYADLAPNPPIPGTQLVVKAKGKFKEKIDEGAYVMLQVKYGLITLIRQKADLCEAIKNVDLTCPLEEGDMELTKEIDIPAQVPPGKYTVNADIFTVDDRQISCLTASVWMGPAKLFG